MAITEKWFTYRDVADRYGVTTMTVYRWVKDGRIKPRIIGGRVYFTEYALRQFERKAREVR